MAQVPNDTRFIGINPTVNLRERRSARINRETQPVSMQDITDSIRPYKVYTALLTQSGGDGGGVLEDNPLTIGVTYQIKTGSTGEFDFTNVGAPNNNINTYFIATGTTPNNWGAAALNYNEGAPVATVLENTIGNIWFEYNDIGQYSANSNNLFTIDKTIIDIDAYGQDGNAQGLALIANTTLNDINKITIYTSKGVQTDSILQKNRIEIRVYN